MSEVFHRRGHHVQSAHGRRITLASDDSHLSGGMIALMPTAEDAKRLALPGGEAAAELHCTLLYLGDDGSVFTPEDRDHMEDAVRSYVQGLGPVQANIFGAAHWNGDGEKPSWVWSVGDGPDSEGPGLAKVHAMAYTGAEDVAGDLIPEQHSPWVAHICAAYTDDLTLVRALEKRLGPVTFDRIRLSFGDDDRDVPLGGEGLTASALRRKPLEHEALTDFAELNQQWVDAVESTANRLYVEMADWRTQIRQQIAAGADTPDEMDQITVTVTDAVAILGDSMEGLARRAGKALQREAEQQGVLVPEWSLPDDVVTAAVGGRRLLRSVARMSADLMASSMVQSARRTLTGMFGLDVTSQALADAVDEVLVDGQEQAVKGPVRTAMSTAQTAGRQAVLQAAPPGEYYASEMLDRSTCGPCKAVDGEQFSDLEIAVKAYPVMGYKDCVGPRYGHSCRGMIVARWTPEETEPVTAAGGDHPFHGNKGDPGYGLLHGDGKIQLKDHLNEKEQEHLQEDLDEAFYAGFSKREYNSRTDPGSSDYDPDEELSDGETDHVDWEGLSRYYASGAGDSWFGDFESSRSIRRAANDLSNLDQTGHDRLLGEGETSSYDRTAAMGLLIGVATAPPLDRPLYRGSYFEGADPDEVEASLRTTDSLDFSVVSFTDGAGVADYFADPSMYQAGDAHSGTQVIYTVDPGAQGVLGHVFNKDKKAGDPGSDPDEADYVESDEALTDFSPDRPREIVTGGRFTVGEITRDGDRLNVRLRQEYTYNPVTGRTTA